MVCKIKSICCISLPAFGYTIGYLGLIYILLIALSYFKIFPVFGNSYDGMYDQPLFCYLYFETGITSVLLIIGTYNKSPLMILPWLVFQGIPLGVFTYWCLYFLIGSIIDHKGSYAGAVALLSSIALSFASIGWYIWFGICSLVRLLKEERNQPQWYTESQPHWNIENQPQWNAKSQPQFEVRTQPILIEA